MTCPERGNEGMSSNPSKSDVLGWTAQILSSHLQHNTVALSDLPEAINSVYRSLHTLSSGETPQEEIRPAVTVRRSITPDYIVCLEDGKKLKMLKRHLKTAYNMTPDEYRQKWGLPAEYPMVAPNYARQRSALAKKIGLGSKGRRRRGGA
jgi:predicted transcriptional regulator